MAAFDLTRAQRIPFEGGVAFQEFDTVLDGKSYTIQAYWNTRDAAWYFNLRDASNVIIFAGIKIVLGVALGRRVTDSRMPGVFIASDLAAAKPEDERDAGYDDFGTRVVVDFYPFDVFFQ